MRRSAMLFALASTLGLPSCSDPPTASAGAIVKPVEVEQHIVHAPEILATAALAFVSTRDGAEHIYVANADGSDVTRLTEGSSPAWSWDDRQLAFVRKGSGAGPGGIYVLNLDDQSVRYLGPGANPTWSPTGRIAFTRVEWWRTSVLSVMNADGSDVSRLYSQDEAFCSGWPCSVTPVPVASGAAWSPDGRSLAFRRAGSVWILAADGSRLRALDELPVPGSAPAWSPEGSRIAIATNPGPWQICDWFLGCHPGSGMGKSSAILSYDRTSGERTQIEPLYPVPAALVRHLDWSPDGSQLVFDLLDLTVSPPCSGWCPDRGPPDPLRIFSMSVETGEVRQLIADAAAPAVVNYSDYGPVWMRAQRGTSTGR